MMKCITSAVFLTFLFTLMPAASVSGQSGIHVEESKKHFKKGVELFKKEKFRDALDEFIKSYDLRPHWGILYNIGVCYLKMNKKARSLMVLLKFMEKGGDEISKSTATEVEDFIQDLMDNVGIIRFSGNLMQARVTIDGEYYPDANENMYLYVDPGKRYIRIVKMGGVLFEGKIIVKKGKEINIDVDAKSHTTGEITEPIVPPVVPPVVPPEGDGGKKKGGGMKIAGWSLAALAGGMLVGYAAAGGFALSQKNKMREIEEDWEECRVSNCTELSYVEEMKKRDDACDKAGNAKIAANVLFALALTSAAASIGLLIGASKKEKKEKQARQPFAFSNPTLAISYDSIFLQMEF